MTLFILYMKWALGREEWRIIEADSMPAAIGYAVGEITKEHTDPVDFRLIGPIK